MFKKFVAALSLITLLIIGTAFAGPSRIVISHEHYGVSWDESQATGGYARTGVLSSYPTGQTLADYLVPIQAVMKRCIMNDSGVIQYYLDPSDSTKKVDGSASVLTGADGQVVVEITAFYYRYSYSDTTHTWDISFYHKPGFVLHPAFIKNDETVSHRYIGAYEGIGWDNSVSAYIDHGNTAATGWSGSAIDTGNDKLSSVSGKNPITDETRAEFRAIAANRGTGWRQLDYDLISAVQLLYLIEYADWNSQSMIGMGRTELTDGTWVQGSYIKETGLSNGDGNGTNAVAYIGDADDPGAEAAYMTYRGIENFWGNIWKWIDGININNNIPYVSNTDTDFADDITTNYTALGVTLVNGNGYQKMLEQISRGFLPASVGGGSSTYITDYYYQNTDWRVAALGGHASRALRAGFASWGLSTSSADDDVSIGGRLCR